MTTKTLTGEAFVGWLEEMDKLGMIVYPISVEENNGLATVSLEITAKTAEVAFIYDFSVFKPIPNIEMTVVPKVPNVTLSFEQMFKDDEKDSIHEGLKKWQQIIQQDCTHGKAEVIDDNLYCTKCGLKLG